MKVFWDVTLLIWQTKWRHIQEGSIFRKGPVNERYTYLYTHEFGIQSHKKLQLINVMSRNTIKLKNKAKIRVIVESITKRMLTAITRE